MKSLKFIIAIGFVAAAVVLLVGCASVKPDGNGGYTGIGFLRTMTYKEEFYESGAVKARTMSTESNTKDVLAGVNELLDTTVDAYSKLKP